MRSAAALLVALASATPSWAGDGAARAAGLIDVPYVSQSELLCGGAAAAMLMRHAGVRAVYAEDFLPLVDASKGGIPAADLRDALAARGFQVRTALGTVSLARAYIVRGHPVMALLEDSPGRLHYVVVVAWSDGNVVYHDPARAPFLRVSEPAFDRAWAASGRWMLVASASRPVKDLRASGGPAVAEPAAAGVRSGALIAFEAGEYRRAAALAERAAREAPAGEAPWRLLAASRYLAGEAEAALDAWNRAGDPRIDLIQLSGLQRTPHRVAERLMGLAPGATLTTRELRRASRRLSLLPASERSRVSYVALPDGLVEIRGAVVDRPLLPARGEWLVEALRAAFSRQIEVPIANLAHAGDRLDLRWGFRDGQRHAKAEYKVPGPSGRGVWTVRGGWRDERYTYGGTSGAGRREAAVEWTDWVTGGLRLAAGAGIARWTQTSAAAPLANSRPASIPVSRAIAAMVDGEIELRSRSDRIGTSLHGAVAAGELDFGSVRLATTWRVPLPGRLQAAGRAALGHATRGTPRDAWFGAGTGQGRPWLLRAHPLFGEGALDGTVFGRTVGQTSIELRRDLQARGLFSLALAGFADAARAWHRPDGSTSPLLVDAGIGLRLRLPSGSTVRLDWARGLRDGTSAVSVGWSVF